VIHQSEIIEIGPGIVGGSTVGCSGFVFREGRRSDGTSQGRRSGPSASWRRMGVWVVPQRSDTRREAVSKKMSCQRTHQS
jgi:hypothetical protein